MSELEGFHAHVYFDESTIDQARRLCEAARDEFPLRMGRVHERLVGPHPRWSCQLAFEPLEFGKIIPRLAMNRSGLVVFIHPETGDAMKDHTEHAIWMGEMLPLSLEIFE